MAGGLGPLAGVGNSCEAPTKVGRNLGRGNLPHLGPLKPSGGGALVGVGDSAGPTTLIAASTGMKVSDLEADPAGFLAL